MHIRGLPESGTIGAAARMSVERPGPLPAANGLLAARGTLDLPVHLNGDYDWDAFDPKDYFAHNYASMRADDAQMLGLVRDWFAATAPETGLRLHGIDVGSGANLYPALALLPHCEAITLLEYAQENILWLKTAVSELPESWKQYCVARQAPGRPDSPVEEAEFEQVRARLRKVCAITQGSIFELEQERWDIGTMFFVAESLTEDPAEFEQALGRFVGALRPGAPFAAAFMEHSGGYEVGGVRFPAVSIDQSRLGAAFGSLGSVSVLELHRVAIDPKPLRPGYSGYLVALGKVKD